MIDWSNAMNIRTPPQIQITEMMGRLSCLKGVATASLASLARSARQLNLRRREILFAKDDPADSLHILVNGQIKLFLSLNNGTDKTLDLVGPGQPVCVAPLWQDKPCPVSSCAQVDSNLIVVGRDAVMREARQDAALVGHLLSAASRQVFGLINDMENCAQRSSLQRVSCFLLQQRPDPDQRAYDILLPSTKRDIATRLSLAQETLSRVFQQLGQEGAIEVKGRYIRVLDSHKLVALNLANCTPQH
jgi:CRP-like cAMP-binding protein